MKIVVEGRGGKQYSIETWHTVHENVTTKRSYIRWNGIVRSGLTKQIGAVSGNADSEAVTLGMLVAMIP